MAIPLLLMLSMQEDREEDNRRREEEDNRRREEDNKNCCPTCGQRILPQQFASANSCPAPVSSNCAYPNSGAVLMGMENKVQCSNNATSNGKVVG